MRNLYILILLFLLSGCDADIYFDSEPDIVVEGWIEEGRAPIIILSNTLNVSDKNQSLDGLRDNIIKWAKVTVSDGEHEEIMLSKVNRKYFPPYIYTTGRMQGEAGKQYSLKVEYQGRVLTAVTTIPPRVRIDTAYAVPSALDGEYSIKVAFRDEAATRDYYKIFSSTDSTSNMYYSTILQTITDSDLQTDSVRWDVYRGRFLDDKYKMYFNEGETVVVKLCHIDSVSYRFWHDYESSLSSSRNAILQYSTNISSNINGGIGYWCGYGSDYRLVRVK